MQYETQRYSFPFPYGWFQVAFSNCLKPGEVLGLRYFGRELIAWRDESETAHVMDAYCPHLGAHIAYGGQVEGCQIRCPYHKWRFDAGGNVTDIPYASSGRAKARLRTYPTIERNGFVMMWYHPTERPPMWEIPEVPEYTAETYTKPSQIEWTIRTCWQEMTENEADLPHFSLVHNEAFPATMKEFKPRDHFLYVKRAHGIRLPTGVLDATVEQENYGPGFVVTKVSSIQLNTCLVSSITPVENEMVNVRFGLNYSKPTLKQQLQALLTTWHLFSKVIQRAAKKQIDEDILLWEHKAYWTTPKLASEMEEYIPLLRRWCAQFYAEEESIYP